jgi:apolipoprotein N-acyltransferase
MDNGNLLWCGCHRFYVTAARPTTQRDDRRRKVTVDNNKTERKMKWDEKNVPHTDTHTPPFLH